MMAAAQIRMSEPLSIRRNATASSTPTRAPFRIMAPPTSNTAVTTALRQSDHEGVSGSFSGSLMAHHGFRGARHRRGWPPDRKSVVSGKSVSVRVDLGGRRIITKKKNKKQNTKQ